MRRRSVPPKQLVQGDTGSEVFQDEESASGVGGDDAGHEVDPEILAEEPERGQFVTQPPWGTTSLALPVRHPLDDDGARERGSALEPDPGHSPRLQSLQAVDGDWRGAEVGQETLQRIDPEDPSGDSHAITLRLAPLASGTRARNRGEQARSSSEHRLGNCEERRHGRENQSVVGRVATYCDGSDRPPSEVGRPQELLLATGGTEDVRPTVDAALARRLLDRQFPQWAGLPLKLLDPAGSDHVIYRLGEELSVRLPRHAGAIGQARKESEWLPRLAPHLPLAIPVPVEVGDPGFGYPWPWAVSR
ncbi:hypothetical protein GCM10009647_022070 [Streptomyces sanglieri]